MVGGVGNIGHSGTNNQGYVIRNIQSSKGMNRTHQNNLMMSQQVMGSSNLGQSNQNFANSQVLNQQQLGIFKAGGPVRATAFNVDHFAGLGHGNSGQILGGRKGVSNSSKGYKRGQGSLGPSQNNGGLRPGTAQKRPASPNTQGLLTKGAISHSSNAVQSPYSFGLVQHHNNLMGGGGSSQGNMLKPRAGHQKPGSAPSKNRIRSQSPMNNEG